MLQSNECQRRMWRSNECCTATNAGGECPADEGCKQRGASTFRDEAFLFLYESNCFQCSILISYLKKIKPLA
jgi:hypothetical protein